MTDLAIVDAAPTPLRVRVGTKFAYGTNGVREALLSFAVSNAHDILEEEILIHAGGREVQARELAGNHGTRLHLVEGVGDGWLEVTYSALVDITRPTGDQVGKEIDFDRWVFTRPSRYAESDRLAPMAAQLFPDQTGIERVRAVTELMVDVYMSTLFDAALQVWTVAAVDESLRARIEPLEGKFGREVHNRTVALLGVDGRDPVVRGLVQATLDLGRGLALANQLSDDSKRRAAVLDAWAPQLAAGLGLLD